MIKVLIVDDHSVLRDGLRQLFALTNDIVVAGEAVNGDKALEQVKQGGFDILLLDMTMPGVCGLELIEHIREIDSMLSILVLTMHNEPQIARRALAAGVSGYLTKDSDSEYLLEAIRKIAAGGRYLAAALAEAIAFGEENDAGIVHHQQLSARELQILRLLAKGENINDIASDLLLSRGSVATYKARMMKKMGFRNDTALVRYALLQGLAS